MSAPPAPPTPRVARRHTRRANVAARYLPAPLRRWLGDEFGAAARVIFSVPVLGVCAACLLALVALCQFPQTRTVNVGGTTNSVRDREDVGRDDDYLYLRDFHEPEQVGSIDFRWTGARARIVLPTVPGNSSWRGTIRLSGHRPPDEAPPIVDVLLDGRLVGRFQTVRAYADYTFTYRREALPPDDLEIVLRTTTFAPPGDGRALGVAVDWLTLEPVDAGPGRPLLPTMQYTLMLLGLLGIGGSLLARLGAGPWVVAAAAAVATVAILVGERLRHDLTAVYIQSLFVVATALLVAVLLARPAVRRLFTAGGVALTSRDERLLLGVFLFGAAVHLAGVFYPSFWAHDMGFQQNRLNDVLRGNLLLSTVSAEWGYRRTPYPPALYLLLAPLAAVSEPSFALRLLPPIVDAASVLPIFYLLRRLRVDDPAPILAAFCYTLLPATYQLLWWGFFPNLFGQFVTLVALALVVGHWDDLARPRWCLALAGVLTVALLSHPGTFVLTLALLPVLAGALTIGQHGRRRGVAALALACGAAVAIAYALYYRHFAGLLLDQLRAAAVGADVLPAGVSADRSWVPAYIGRRVFALPFLLYFTLTWVAGIGLAFARRPLGWALLAILLTATAFAAVHVVAGVWVRYFVFVSPALAMGTGVALGWLVRRGRWGQVVTYVTLTYGLAAASHFWLGVAVIGKRSPYP